MLAILNSKKETGKHPASNLEIKKHLKSATYINAL